MVSNACCQLTAYEESCEGSGDEEPNKDATAAEFLQRGAQHLLLYHKLLGRQ